MPCTISSVPLLFLNTSPTPRFIIEHFFTISYLFTVSHRACVKCFHFFRSSSASYYLYIYLFIYGGVVVRVLCVFFFSLGFPFLFSVVLLTFVNYGSYFDPRRVPCKHDCAGVVVLSSSTLYVVLLSR